MRSITSEHIKENLMKQKDIFLNSEGNNWFARNVSTVAGLNLPDDDPLLLEILDCVSTESNSKLKILEIGCGDGTRLAWLKHNFNAECYGVEPSSQAVKAALTKGISVQQGTADDLPFDNQSFDIVIFGFCLYLCDEEDLFRIASEADRVLRMPGWLMAMDFYSPNPRMRAYHHLKSIQSHKMDYRTLFTWHPVYECLTHKVRDHRENNYTDLQEEWVSIFVLRKFKKEFII